MDNIENKSKNRVEVVIDGQIITLVSDEQEAYMQKLALYIDKKLSEIKSSKSNKPVGESLRTLLISVNIADDYFKSLEKHQGLEKTHENYMNEMGRMQEENLLVTDKLQELQGQLSHVREKYVSEVNELQEENARLTEVNKNLQEQLQYAREELDEYISTFDDGENEGDVLQDEIQNVVNFNPNPNTKVGS